MRLLTWLLLLAGTTVAADPLRVRVVTGGHSHEPSFYTMFEAMPELKVDVEPHPKAFEGNLTKRVDVLVLYDMITVSTPEQRDRLRTFAESGKGIVILHHAICGYVDWPWWYENVAGGRYLTTSTYKHDVTIPVKITGQHPVTAGLKDFTVFDETYKGMWISDKVNVLASTTEKTSDGPLVWVSPFEKSRVVFVQLGHGHQAHQDLNYRQLVRQAIEWAGGRR
ncbi:MAG: ThuA domain-containing protein [Acidobacteria bacterium]|nr:ThuA domain-containing protein [Acidobacteriota bacterium]